jgi:hypothetical protein
LNKELLPASKRGKLGKAKRDSQNLSKSQLFVKELSNVKLRKTDNSLDLKTKLENKKRLSDIQNRRAKARSQIKKSNLQFYWNESTPKDYSWSSKFSDRMLGFQELNCKGICIE